MDTESKNTNNDLLLVMIVLVIGGLIYNQLIGERDATTNKLLLVFALVLVLYLFHKRYMDKVSESYKNKEYFENANLNKYSPHSYYDPALRYSKQMKHFYLADEKQPLLENFLSLAEPEQPIINTGQISIGDGSGAGSDPIVVTTDSITDPITETKDLNAATNTGTETTNEVNEIGNALHNQELKTMSFRFDDKAGIFDNSPHIYTQNINEENCDDLEGIDMLLCKVGFEQVPNIRKIQENSRPYTYDTLINSIESGDGNQVSKEDEDKATTTPAQEQTTTAISPPDSDKFQLIDIKLSTEGQNATENATEIEGQNATEIEGQNATEEQTSIETTNNTQTPTETATTTEPETRKIVVNEEEEKGFLQNLFGDLF